MTDATRRALRELLAKKSAGEWLACRKKDPPHTEWDFTLGTKEDWCIKIRTDEGAVSGVGFIADLLDEEEHSENDARLIVAAVNALDDLLDALDEAEAERDRLRATLCSLLVSTDGVTDVGWEGVNRMRVLIADALGRGGSDGESEKFSREWWEARLGVPVKHYDEKMRMPYYDMNVLECWCGQPSAHESGGCAAHYRLVLDGQ